jgi:hypothetical protein
MKMKKKLKDDLLIVLSFFMPAVKRSEVKEITLFLGLFFMTGGNFNPRYWEREDLKLSSLTAYQLGRIMSNEDGPDMYSLTQILIRASRGDKCLFMGVNLTGKQRTKHKEIICFLESYVDHMHYAKAAIKILKKELKKNTVSP